MSRAKKNSVRYRLCNGWHRGHSEHSVDLDIIVERTSDYDKPRVWLHPACDTEPHDTEPRYYEKTRQWYIELNGWNGPQRTFVTPPEPRLEDVRWKTFSPAKN